MQTEAETERRSYKLREAEGFQDPPEAGRQGRVLPLSLQRE